jgi:hypothetical protein
MGVWECGQIFYLLNYFTNPMASHLHLYNLITNVFKCTPILPYSLTSSLSSDQFPHITHSAGNSRGCGRKRARQERTCTGSLSAFEIPVAG